VPAETNMVSQKPLLEKAARDNGFELKAMAANTTAEVADATLALISAHVDAICQIPGNLTAAAFPSIAQHAVRAKVPIFAFQSAQVDQSVLTLARDYSESGRMAGQMAARVMRGEAPAGIPLQAVSSIQIIVNEKAAAAAGLVTPADVRAKAQKTIR
jgi:putative ABC transport system substrate-binding protein